MLKSVYLLRLLLVFRSLFGRGVFYREFIVLVVEHALFGYGAAAGRYQLARTVIFHVLDTVGTHYKPPVSLGVLGVFSDDNAILVYRAVEVVAAALLAGAVERQRQCLALFFLKPKFVAAGKAFRRSAVCGVLQLAAAYLAS